MKKYIFFWSIMTCGFAGAQVKVDLLQLPKGHEAKVVVQNNLIDITWPAGGEKFAKIVIDLSDKKPLFKSFQLGAKNNLSEISTDLDAVFLLTVGKRDLVSQNGWNIFFDKTGKLPHETFAAELNRRSARVSGTGSRTKLEIGEMNAGPFAGVLEITLFDGSPLVNIAAVLSTQVDSTAILYDAGFVSKHATWKKISWNDPVDQPQSSYVLPGDTARNLAVKYRAIVASGKTGSLALFPAPHQYFYPLDEAFNLKFTWYGTRYRELIDGYGVGIRQDLAGDGRWVPWSNAPPGTMQRLGFFCLLSGSDAAVALDSVKRFTHGDSYKPLAGYKTMSSHFHNEYIMKVVLAYKAMPGIPPFVNVFNKTGIDIVHLGEFHYSAHPKGPGEKRLAELKALFDTCREFSNKHFLLLPGEEPNEFFGGHWMALFPKPVYWIMARESGSAFSSWEAPYGNVYRVRDKEEMLQLLEHENGLAWTAHARTKGSTGYPDKYRDEPFFKSDRFLGAAWKAMPADLSEPKLGRRVLDLADDMSNWGAKKHIIGEADLFSIEPENEMYAHLNVNYLRLDSLPDFDDGWQPVLDRMRKGKFFVTTGEVLLPVFTVNGKGPGETIQAGQGSKARIILEASWTFPLNFAEIISGDGKKVYREKIAMDHTRAFGNDTLTLETNLENRKWIRMELWDVAANGAFTQQVWID